MVRPFENPTPILSDRENQFVESIVNRLLVARVPVDIAKAVVSKPLLNTAEAAKVLGTTEGTLHVWRSVGRYPIKFIRVGSKIRYRLEDLLSWLESRTETPEPRNVTPRPEPKRKPRK